MRAAMLLDLEHGHYITAQQHIADTGDHTHADSRGRGYLRAMQGHALAPDLTAKQIGSLGERLCRAWLIEHHWHVLACNWHCRFGEIDIIALTSHSTIVFVEVKTRRSTSCGIPEEAVHAAKQMRVRRAAICWLGEHGSTIRHIGVRFDVIAVTVTPTDVFIHHVPEAF